MVKSKKNYYKTDDYYYHIEDDITYGDVLYTTGRIEHPVFIYIVIGGRSTGKTYSALKYLYEQKKQFGFIKRTNDDVSMILNSKNVEGAEFSPFVPINRDLGCEVDTIALSKGVASFVEDNKEIGRILSLNAISNIAGFDMSKLDYLVFDEFIPKQGERIFRKEGDKFFDLYRTVSRDREHRGREPLKVFMLANANRLYNPILESMELIDTVSLMKVNGDVYNVLDNGILIHILDDNPDFIQEEQDTAIMQAFGHTQWGKMALNNEFAYDDVSCIGYTSLNGYRCRVSFIHKETAFFVYQRKQSWYICKSPNKCKDVYDLNRETEQVRFYQEQLFTLRAHAVQGDMLFSDYTSYYIIMNYKRVFDI